MHKVNADTLLMVLRNHIGRANGVTASALVREIYGYEAPLAERFVRHVVADLRNAGHHVCAHPSDGYFLAESAEELDETCAFLHARAMSSLKQIAAMKRISVPDLHGQLHLPT